MANRSGNGKANLDDRTVAGFGDEWSRFDQSKLDEVESEQLFSQYFSVFPWDSLPTDPVGFDLGCGSGRWAHHVAAKIGVGTLHCIDPSSALDVARRNLEEHTNCVFHLASVDEIPLPDDSLDFGYSLGVLHHIPDTTAGIRSCVKKLKIGAPFLVYLYYDFDNQPGWFRTLWKASDLLRRGISQLPHPLRFAVSQVIATLVYFPLARTAKLVEKLGRDVKAFPLSAYRNLSFYTMRTDALDRFGTSLEQRFSRAQIEGMMLAAGLKDINFNEDGPFWCAAGTRST
jgi:ubiquinone/menaquinone biosynthesis C-methylase UbiE